MNYNECMEYLEEVNRKNGMVMGLEPMRALLKQLGNPEKTVKNIHIAGTNGKGSVSTFIAYILNEMGYTVGRYVSPAVDGYTERVQKLVNGEKSYISKEEVAEYISRIRCISEENMKDLRQLTQFEIETAMAYMAFERWKCDYVVLECGLGGSEDATNAVDNKDMCVFTSISKDHTAILGNTEAEIAYNKAGIMRNGVKVVSAVQSGAVSKVLEEYAGRNNAVVRYCDVPQGCIYNIKDTIFEISGEKYTVNMPGTYQPDNASVAIKAVKELSDKADLSGTMINNALRKAVWPHRFEVISEKPYLIIDGAHNVAGIKVLAESINTLFPADVYRRIGIMGVFADKDTDGMLKNIKGLFEIIHTVTAPGKRGMDAGALAEKIGIITDTGTIVHENMSAHEVSEDIINKTVYGEREKTVIVIFGSLSLCTVE